MKCLGQRAVAPRRITISCLKTSRRAVSWRDSRKAKPRIGAGARRHVACLRLALRAGRLNDVTLFKSKDLQTWQQKVVVKQEREHLFNSSVCAAENGFVMAYESDDQSTCRSP